MPHYNTSVKLLPRRRRKSWAVVTGRKCSPIRYDTMRLRYDAIRYDTIRCDTIRYDTYDTIRYNAMKYDATRQDIRYDSRHNIIIWHRFIGFYSAHDSHINSYTVKQGDATWCNVMPYAMHCTRLCNTRRYMARRRHKLAPERHLLLKQPNHRLYDWN